MADRRSAVNRSLKFALAVAVIATIAAALGVGYWFGRQQPATATGVAVADPAGGETSASPTPAGESERKILYYRNPMGLPDTSPEPKKDSMGMDYIAVYADDEPDGSGVVKVSPARIQTLGVKTARAEERTLDAALR
ncbi:efflux RND transporter periplasmic adaptor subunit, partial [Candidatus Accumulibacter phosphatis]|nr:efflux RND transporter periplasmic adaptor subunit [Candidatus Accumulibacter phosphatis]